MEVLLGFAIGVFIGWIISRLVWRLDEAPRVPRELDYQEEKNPARTQFRTQWGQPSRKKPKIPNFKGVLSGRKNPEQPGGDGKKTPDRPGSRD